MADPTSSKGANTLCRSRLHSSIQNMRRAPQIEQANQVMIYLIVDIKNKEYKLIIDNH